MTDLIAELRAHDTGDDHTSQQLLMRAADALEEKDRTIERLRAEVNSWQLSANMFLAETDRLRQVLRNISKGRVGDQLIMDVAAYAKAQLAE